jgi:hypothetical protein
MSKSCASCRWFDASFAPDDDPREALGLCEWPASLLPHSLRWGNRERVAVSPLEGTECSCHEPRPEPPAGVLSYEKWREEQMRNVDKD